MHKNDEIKKELMRDIELFDEFSHPNISDELADRIVNKMGYAWRVRYWITIASKVAAAACIVLGLMIFAFVKFDISPAFVNSINSNNSISTNSSNNLNSSNNSIISGSSRSQTFAYNTNQSDIDEEIDILYDEFDNTISLKGDTLDENNDILDNINKDVNELTMEINNG